MENKELKISADNALTAYKNADANERELLERLFGKEVFASANVMERVKTFEDACRELGGNHPLMKSYEALCSVDTDNDLEAYAKLRIIVAALNEGWVPKYMEGEYRYYPWFYLYTQEEIENMDGDEKKQLGVVGGLSTSGAACGIAASSASDSVSNANADFSAHLALKREELARYCGEQFILIWADYLL